MTFCSGILLIVTNVRYILTMQQCKKLSRHLSSQSRSHSLSPIEGLSATECQRRVSSCDRYRGDGEWLTRELCLSKHNLHCILAVTTGKPVEFTQCRGRDQYVLPHEGLTAAALMWTGHQEIHKDDVGGINQNVLLDGFNASGQPMFVKVDESYYNVSQKMWLHFLE